VVARRGFRKVNRSGPPLYDNATYRPLSGRLPNYFGTAREALSRLHSRHSARRRPLPGGCRLVQAEALSGVGRAATRGQAEAGLEVHAHAS